MRPLHETRRLATIFGLLASLSATTIAEEPRLRVSDDHRFLVREDGTPFFYLGDTAWELFHRLTLDEAKAYFDDRASKGFNVIQTVVLAEFDGLTEPNRSGDLPLLLNDPGRPNEPYFRHVDAVVAEANRRALFVGMLPTWGDKVNKKWGIGPVVFTPENARVYGEFLGKRYKDRAILWILGGDRPIESPVHRAIWDAMAAGIKSGDGGRHLITYHPSGGQSSSRFLQDAPWLDFHMLQSGHGRKFIANDGMIEADFRKSPTRPCIDGEPNYEDHPIGFKAENGYFDEMDVRRAAYQAVFAGACGHTYGCHDIWQFLSTRHKPITAARTPWREALKLPGSSQVGYLRRLIESRPSLLRLPDSTLVKFANSDRPRRVPALRAKDGSYAMIYLATNEPIAVDLDRLSGETIRATWFDPRTGKPAGQENVARKGSRLFTPPANGVDWVLVLDDVSKNYPEPGSALR